MHRLSFGFAVVATAAIAAVPALAGVPNGKGLVVTVGLNCDGNEPDTIVLTRGLGATGWSMTTDSHYVVKAFGITTTLIPEGGGAPIVESFYDTFGNKTGLGTPSRCEGSFEEAIPGVGALSGSIRGELVYVPAGS